MAKSAAKKAATPKAAPKADAQPDANLGANASDQGAAKSDASGSAVQPAKAAPSHADRLDKLEADHAALLDIARANGWSLPG